MPRVGRLLDQDLREVGAGGGPAEVARRYLAATTAEMAAHRRSLAPRAAGDQAPDG